MPRQLAFDLPVRPALGREAFFVSPANASALKAMETWENWPSGRHLLTGPAGSGKTHLAHVWAALAGARIVAGASLSPEAIPDLASAPLALEDIDRGTDETLLFHLLNLAQAEGTPLLLTASAAPAATLPDLASRLAAIPVARLEPPDDALLAALLVKLFADRQIAAPPTLIAYLVPRIERSFAAASRIVAALDATALAERKPVSRSLAARLLDNPRPDHT